MRKFHLTSLNDFTRRCEQSSGEAGHGGRQWWCLVCLLKEVTMDTDTSEWSARPPCPDFTIVLYRELLQIPPT